MAKRLLTDGLLNAACRGWTNYCDGWSARSVSRTGRSSASTVRRGIRSVPRAANGWWTRAPSAAPTVYHPSSPRTRAVVGSFTSTMQVLSRRSRAVASSNAMSAIATTSGEKVRSCNRIVAGSRSISTAGSRAGTNGILIISITSDPIIR